MPPILMEWPGALPVPRPAWTQLRPALEPRSQVGSTLRHNNPLLIRKKIKQLQEFRLPVYGRQYYSPCPVAALPAVGQSGSGTTVRDSTCLSTMLVSILATWAMLARLSFTKRS